MIKPILFAVDKKIKLFYHSRYERNHYARWQTISRSTGRRSRRGKD